MSTILESVPVAVGMAAGTIVFAAFNFAHNLKLPPQRTLLETLEPMILGLIITSILGLLIGAVVGIIAALVGGSLLLTVLVAGGAAAFAARKLHEAY